MTPEMFVVSILSALTMASPAPVTVHITQNDKVFYLFVHLPLIWKLFEGQDCVHFI